MRTSIALATLALGATAASAQLSTASILQYVSSLVSTECVTAIEGLVSPTSSLGKCLRTDLLLSALNETSSLVPDVDSYLSTFCSSDPCSETTFQNASTTILSACASDLTKFGLTNETIELVFDVQPLAREVLCLKTADPYNVANATIPINSTAYNSTNGTFCATSLLTELSSYLGSNLTLTYIETAALGGNATALKTIESIPPTALCSDCVFAAIDLVEQSIPSIANYTFGNYSLNTFIGGTCSSSGLGLNITTNGTLPGNITESAFNSSYPYNVTNGNVTYTASVPLSTANISSIIANLTGGYSTEISKVSSIAASVTSSAAAEITSSGNTTALKKRWIGA